MLSKLFGSIKQHEFETPEVKVNKKVTNKSAHQHDLPLPQTQNTVDSKKKDQLGRLTPPVTNSNKKETYNNLNSLEQHYYVQIEKLLKNSSESKVREAIKRFNNSAEINSTRLVEILDMIIKK
jgi:hypothetical protein